MPPYFGSINQYFNQGNAYKTTPDYGLMYL